MFSVNDDIMVGGAVTVCVIVVGEVPHWTRAWSEGLKCGVGTKWFQDMAMAVSLMWVR